MNIINAQVTADINGNSVPYRRKMVVWESGPQKYRIVDDLTPFITRYDPGHPNANSNGMVNFPNVDTVSEKLDIVEAEKELRERK